MCVRCRKHHSFGKNVTQWHIIPGANFIWVQVIDTAQTEQLVQARHYATILKVRQPTDMDDEFWSPVALGDLVTRLFNITVGKAQPLSNLPKPSTGKQICWDSRVNP